MQDDDACTLHIKKQPAMKEATPGIFHDQFIHGCPSGNVTRSFSHSNPVVLVREHQRSREEAK
jgi:hypothetical protein